MLVKEEILNIRVVTKSVSLLAFIASWLKRKAQTADKPKKKGGPVRFVRPATLRLQSPVRCADYLASASLDKQTTMLNLRHDHALHFAHVSQLWSRTVAGLYYNHALPGYHVIGAH